MQKETVYSTLLGVDAGLPPIAHTEQVTEMTKYANSQHLSSTGHMSHVIVLLLHG